MYIYYKTSFENTNKFQELLNKFTLKKKEYEILLIQRKNDLVAYELKHNENKRIINNLKMERENYTNMIEEYKRKISENIQIYINKDEEMNNGFLYYCENPIDTIFLKKKIVFI